MNVDGTPVLNYLDTDANNPIAAEGYLNVYSYNNGDGNFIELKPVEGAEPGDTTPPVWTAGRLIVTNKDTASVTLNWSGASDNTGVTKYKIYKDGQEAATVEGAVYTVTGLLPDTAYVFQVQAGDAAGNWSGDGPVITVSTSGVVTPVSATGTLTGPSTVLEGKTYELNFGLKQVMGEIAAEDLTVGFDPELFEFESVEALLPDFTILTHTVSPGSVRVILASTNGSGGAVAADSELLKLRFKAKSLDQQATGTFTVQQNLITNIGGSGAEVTTAPHSVTIQAIQPGDLDTDGTFTIMDLGLLIGMYGKTNADPDWSLYEAADLDADGEIGLMELTMIARKIIGE
jgi:hypothetical protein